ncbi:MAG: protein tyrosine phosphatase [Candidatus Rokuibacteriota bacterium]
MNVLFVCTGNQARSPMAETLFHELAGSGGRHAARSAGTGAGAVRRLTTRELAWADVVAVMETAHLDEIRSRWPDHARKVKVLGVPDDYDPDDPDLRALLSKRVGHLLDDLGVRRVGSLGPLRSPSAKRRG